MQHGRFAIGAYNSNTMEQVLGLLSGHMLADTPFIVQAKGARAGTDDRGDHPPGRKARIAWTASCYPPRRRLVGWIVFAGLRIGDDVRSGTIVAKGKAA